MSKRFRLTPAIATLAVALVGAAAVVNACAGNPYGECVTVYSDGDVFRYSTDKAYCEDTCAERIASNPGLISSCYFAGARAAPTEP